MTSPSERLDQRWLRFWRESGAAGDPLPLWLALKRRHSEAHRSYHVLAHVAHCLDELEDVRSLASDPIAVELALWFHDVVYDSHAKDNEAQSALLAGQVAESMGLSEARRDTIRRLILATRHDVLPAPGDESLVVDIDLAILGQPRERFDEYERQVRIEYAWVPQPIFEAKRLEILRSFLRRDSIYSTEHFRARYEDAAWANLSRSLAPRGVGA